MIMFKKILIAVDGSENSDRALKIGINLGKKFSSEIQIFTVVPPLLVPLHALPVTTSELVSEATKELEKTFADVLKKAEEKAKKNNRTLKISTKLEYGKPGKKIVETAREGKFDLVVMGSRGLGRKEYALGSVSTRVTDCANCPVLIVK